MAQTRANTVQQEREEVYAALQYAASSHCLVEEWKDCGDVGPQPEEKWILLERSGVLLYASTDVRDVEEAAGA